MADVYLFPIEAGSDIVLHELAAIQAPVTPPVEPPVQPPVVGGGGGGGPVREIRAYAKEFDRIERKRPAKKSRKKPSPRMLEGQPLQLIPNQLAFASPALSLAQLAARQMPDAGWSPARAMQLASLPRLAVAEAPAPVVELDPVQQMLADLEAELELELRRLME